MEQMNLDAAVLRDAIREDFLLANQMPRLFWSK
jgi:hypothetical protein